MGVDGFVATGGDAGIVTELLAGVVEPPEDKAELPSHAGESLEQVGVTGSEPLR